MVAKHNRAGGRRHAGSNGDANLRAQSAGIECRKDVGVLVEIPAACKDIDQVMADQRDLVEVVHTLEQVLNVKGWARRRPG
jgi:RNA-splicing ligase RtcB